MSDEPDPELAPAAPGMSIPFKLTRRKDAPPVGDEMDALIVFRLAANDLKHAELAYREAQQHYGEAVKRLSEEAVK